MKAIMISGSRDPQGQTARASEAVLEGIHESGGKTESFFLPGLTIERCRQCDENGWGICKSEGKCIISDAFVELFDKISQSDVVIFATPVYFGDLSESLRAFTDRLRRVARDSKVMSILKSKTVLGICVAGGGGGGAPECCASLKKVCTQSGFDVVDMIPVRRQNLQAKLERLKLTGQWLSSIPSSQ